MKLDSVSLYRDMQLCFSKLWVYAADKIMQAHDFIYQQGRPVDGIAIRRLLDSESLVPTMVFPGL